VRANRLRRRSRVTLALAWALFSVSVPPAAAQERVSDGGFDAAACSATDCVSSAWSESGGPYLSEATGPICNGGTSGCADGGDGYHTPYNWARLGSFTIGSGTEYTAVEQPVAIPAAPATLRFALLTLTSTTSTGTFRVTLDGTPLFNSTDVSLYPYTYVTIPVGSFAGPGTHPLKFTGTALTPDEGQPTDSFNLDSISLDAPNLGAPGAGSGKPGKCGGKTATITGTNSGEPLRGTGGKDVIQALGGKDLVKGGAGNDLICGGTGKDTLRGNAGKDKLLGEGGKDLLSGGAKPDTCVGGPGKDAEKSC
jgi:hypothetical protein